MNITNIKLNIVELKTANKTYELKLTTRGVVKLEKAIGKNPISLFVTDAGGTRIPTISECALVLYYALQPEAKNLDAVYDILDEFEGSFNDLVVIIIDLFKASGIIPEDEDNSERKN